MNKKYIRKKNIGNKRSEYTKNFKISFYMLFYYINNRIENSIIEMKSENIKKVFLRKDILMLRW